jgi:hypothetical protein
VKPTRPLLILLTLVTLIGLSFGTVKYIQRAASEHVFAYNCGIVDYKPTSLTPVCANTSVIVANIHWEKWSKDLATGTAQYGVNMCNPDCATSAWTYASVEIQLTKSILDKGKRILTRIDYVTADKQNLPLSNSDKGGFVLQRTPL